MKQKSLTILGLLLIITVGVVSVSAVLYTTVYATIEGNVTIQGKNIYRIQMWSNWNGSDEIILSPQGAILQLPSNISQVNDGWIVRGIYYLHNGDNNTHFVNVSIDSSWFNDTTHPWYGFIYGLSHHGNDSDVPIITKQTLTLPPHQTIHLYIWFKVKDNMLTPPGGYVHPTILIETI